MTQLHEELIPYLVEGPLGKMIHHPYLIHIVYSVHMNDVINAQYEAKKQAIEKALNDEHHHSYIFLHERPYRINALMQVIAKVKQHDEMLDLVKSVYVDSENIWESLQDWRFVLEYFAIQKDDNVSNDDIVIYRGYNHEESKLGFSWTESLETAKWFSNRYAVGEHIGKVVKAKVKIKDILFKCDDRGEKEVVVIPDDVYDIKDL